MNFKFHNLLGAPYRGGNIVIKGNELLSPVGNRLSQVNLVESVSSTSPFENAKQVQTFCISPNGQLLLSIDEDGRSLLINWERRTLLHHFTFKQPVAAAKFSPDGRYIACAVGRLLQVWETPALAKSMSPMQLHRTYGTCHDDITCLDWSADSKWIAVGAKDLTNRVFSLNPVEGFRPPVLTGHKDMPLAVFFAGSQTANAARIGGKLPPELYTISRDGALHSFVYLIDPLQSEAASPAAEVPGAGNDQSRVDTDVVSVAKLPSYTGGHWKLHEKFYFNHRGAKVSAVDWHAASSMLIVAFSNGIFDLYEMPTFQNVHTLSVSSHRISATAFNGTGNLVAVGCATLGQLLVWDWRAETYVLKQQGHYHDVSAVAYSPDGAMMATGADDAKVKVWSLASGFCFVTFADHSAPVTSLAWLPSGNAVLSASLDGTVRAMDLLRYRTFRTFTTPRPSQFTCLAVDPSGEVVCAGSQDTFEVVVWSVKTGRLLDILAGHEGPVASLAFSPNGPLLATASWDHTLRTWDVFTGKGAVETLPHSHDVLAVAFRPDGKALACSTLDGCIHIWNPLDGEIMGTIEGRRDIVGGRLASDRRAAGNTASGQCFTSLAYSADGALLMAGGKSKFVCIYDADEKLLLRRFQISHNRSLDGVLDQLNSRNMTDAGPADQIVDSPDDEDDMELLGPGGDPRGVGDLPGTGSNRKVAIRSRAVALSPTGRSWAAATTEGVVMYSLDEGLMFDPTDLGTDVTPAAVHTAIRRGASLQAMLLALRLAQPDLLQHAILSTPPRQVAAVASSLPTASVPAMLPVLAQALASSPHLEFLLSWVQALCLRRDVSQKGLAASCSPALRALQKVLGQMHDDLAGPTEDNLYTLQYLAQCKQSPQEVAASEAPAIET